MRGYRVQALQQATADEVRSQLKAPGYGHPAHVEVARGAGPCRLCLGTFRKGEEERVLFTYNPFVDSAIPCPGPIFVHKEACPRYEGPGFPSGLVGSFSLILEGYDADGLAVGRKTIDADADASIDAILSIPRVAFAHVRNAEAGCFIARIDPA